MGGRETDYFHCWVQLICNVKIGNRNSEFWCEHGVVHWSTSPPTTGPNKILIWKQLVRRIRGRMMEHWKWIREHSFIFISKKWTLAAWTIKYYHHVKHQIQWWWEREWERIYTICYSFLNFEMSKFVHEDIKSDTNIQTFSSNWEPLVMSLTLSFVMNQNVKLNSILKYSMEEASLVCNI